MDILASSIFGYRLFCIVIKAAGDGLRLHGTEQNVTNHAQKSGSKGHFSLLGGITAMAVMIALKQCRRLSVYGVSIGGAAAHNIGQIVAAIITLGDTAVLGYLPILLAVSPITGAVTGLVTALLFRAMKNVHLSKGV